MDWWFVLYVLAMGLFVFNHLGWRRALKGWKKANDLAQQAGNGWQTCVTGLDKAAALAQDMTKYIEIQRNLITEQQEELRKWRTAYGPTPPEPETEPGGFLN